MTVVAMWCRHLGDDVIGIGKHIPWNVPSDAKHFLDVVAGQTIVCGRVTYESFPNRTIEGCRIFVLTSDENYEVSDEAHHCVITSQKAMADVEEDIYVAGGAAVYALFMTGKEKLKPRIVVDCVYHGEMQNLEGERAVITDSVAVLQKNYRRVSPFYVRDEVESAIWVRKGEFVEQSVLKRLVGILEQNAEIRW